MPLIRLNKFLSDSGICSRREADEHILRGKVKINGKNASLGDKVDTETDIVEFENEVIRPFKEKLIYYALYKPKGIISTSSDEKNRKNVTDLVPKKPRVYPIGRLDKDSEGLMILTNDGELTNTLTHPSYEHEKEYLVTVEIANDNLRTKDSAYIVNFIQKKFLNGLLIDSKKMVADKIKIIPLTHDSKYAIQIIIHTGYNRQIRKMCDKIGLEVKKLIRTKIAKLSLNDIKLLPGEYKVISKEEIL